MIAAEMTDIRNGQNIREFHSPYWMRVTAIMTVFLLISGVVLTIVDRNVMTGALVPLGFTLWAVLANSIRSRGQSIG
jgi:hypothetical protein